VTSTPSALILIPSLVAWVSLVEDGHDGGMIRGVGVNIVGNVAALGELKFGIDKSGILIWSLVLVLVFVVYCIDEAAVRPRGDALNARGMIGCRFPTSSSSIGDGRRIGDRL
jgi:hypothetical protein